MHFFGLVKNNKIFLIIAILSLIILAITISIVNLGNNKLAINRQTGFTGYYDLKTKINKIANDNPTVGQNRNYQKMVTSIALIEETKASKEDKHKALYEAFNYIIVAYAETNDHNLYLLQKDLASFINLNFPKDNTDNLKPSCFDPICANPPSTEITNVINKIQSSNLPSYIKKSDIKMLKNFSYLTNDNSGSKTGDFLIVASMIKNNSEYIKLGINIKISDEIINYVKNAYPKEYDNFTQNKSQNPINQ